MYRGHPNPYVRARPNLPWPPPGDDQTSRAILGKLWELAEIKAIAQSQLDHEHENLVFAVTEDCVKDIQKLEFTPVDLATHILQLDDRNYDKSLWCKKSVQPGVRIDEAALWCPCDSYVIPVRETYKSGFSGEVKYYIKLCLSPANKSVLLVSFHL